MSNSTRTVRTEFSHNDYLIYRLLDESSPTTEVVFGYSQRNDLWIQILGIDQSNMTIIPQEASEVKEAIAAWCR